MPMGQLFSLKRRKLHRFKRFLSLRVKHKALLFGKPKYSFISYKFMFAYLLKAPKIKDLVFPIPIDMLRLAGYY